MTRRRRESRRWRKWVLLCGTVCLLTVWCASILFCAWCRYSGGERIVVVFCGCVAFGPGDGSDTLGDDVVWAWPTVKGIARESEWSVILQRQVGFCWPGKTSRGVYRFPLWMPFVALISLTAATWYRDRRSPPGFCPMCRYDLTGNTSGTCPECGTEVAES